MSVIDVLGVIFYSAVVMLCFAASRAAQRADRPGADSRVWLYCAAFFTMLALSRIFEFEDVWRAEARQYLVSHAEYAGRRAIQRPLLGLALVGSCALVAGTWYALRRNMNGARRYVSLAQIAMIGFVPLFALRMVSFHFMDRLLYGPLKLNWLLDGGLTALAALSALAYARHVRMAAPHGGTRRRE